MKIIYLPDLIPFLRHKHLLLDTNVFRDAATKPTLYHNFFNTLKENDVTLVTIDFVKYELLKGSSDRTKYEAKEKLIDDIVDAILPINPQIYPSVFELIEMYGIDGTSLSLTDLTIGAFLMQYPSNLCFMTRDTTDFKQTIFNLPYVLNVTNSKGIFTYGIYQYTK